MTIAHLTTAGKLEQKDTKSVLFTTPVNKVLIAQAVRVYLANARQGTSSTKTRAEVSRTKKKWFKQKGTGNARHGSRSPSLFVGGGVAFGPHANQQWALTLPKELKRQALLSALSAQVEHCVVADQVDALKGKTKDAAKLLTPVTKENKKLLVILSEKTDSVQKALRNLSTVLVRYSNRVTTLEVAMADTIVFTSKAIEALEQRLALDTDKKSPKKAKEVVAKTVETKSKPVKKVAAKKAVAKPKTATKK